VADLDILTSDLQGVLPHKLRLYGILMGCKWEWWEWRTTYHPQRTWYQSWHLFKFLPNLRFWSAFKKSDWNVEWSETRNQTKSAFIPTTQCLLPFFTRSLL